MLNSNKKAEIEMISSFLIPLFVDSKILMLRIKETIEDRWRNQSL